MASVICKRSSRTRIGGAGTYGVAGDVMTGGVWNMVFSGVPGGPAATTFPQPVYTVLPTTLLTDLRQLDRQVSDRLEARQLVARQPAHMRPCRFMTEDQRIGLSAVDQRLGRISAPTCPRPSGSPPHSWIRPGSSSVTWSSTSDVALAGS